VESPSESFQAAFILLSVAVIMVVFWYLGREPFFNRHLRPLVPPTAYAPVYSFFYFSAASLLLRGLLPVLFIRRVFRKPLRQLGYGFKGSWELWYVYLILVAVILPVVIWAGRFATFQQTYPLCRYAIQEGRLPLELFLVYQAAYLLVFVSGESFWRGYIVFGLRPLMGQHAILVMTIPYAMSHFGKPFPEAMGAILVGIVLGYMALRHGNFWLGVLAHYSVALTMDLTAIAYRGIVFA
jgi:membrane protease YdiL (CAAX protease family)